MLRIRKITILAGKKKMTHASCQDHRTLLLLEFMFLACFWRLIENEMACPLPLLYSWLTTNERWRELIQV